MMTTRVSQPGRNRARAESVSPTPRRWLVAGAGIAIAVLFIVVGLHALGGRPTRVTVTPAGPAGGAAKAYTIEPMVLPKAQTFQTSDRSATTASAYRVTIAGSFPVRDDALVVYADGLPIGFATEGADAGSASLVVPAAWLHDGAKLSYGYATGALTVLAQPVQVAS